MLLIKRRAASRSAGRSYPFVALVLALGKEGVEPLCDVERRRSTARSCPDRVTARRPREVTCHANHLEHVLVAVALLEIRLHVVELDMELPIDREDRQDGADAVRGAELVTLLHEHAGTAFEGTEQIDHDLLLLVDGEVFQRSPVAAEREQHRPEAAHVEDAFARCPTTPVLARALAEQDAPLEGGRHVVIERTCQAVRVLFGRPAELAVLIRELESVRRVDPHATRLKSEQLTTLIVARVQYCGDLELVLLHRLQVPLFDEANDGDQAMLTVDHLVPGRHLARRVSEEIPGVRHPASDQVDDDVLGERDPLLHRPHDAVDVVVLETALYPGLVVVLEAIEQRVLRELLRAGGELVEEASLLAAAERGDDVLEHVARIDLALTAAHDFLLRKWGVVEVPDLVELLDLRRIGQLVTAALSLNQKPLIDQVTKDVVHETTTASLFPSTSCRDDTTDLRLVRTSASDVFLERSSNTIHVVRFTPADESCRFLQFWHPGSPMNCP